MKSRWVSLAIFVVIVTLAAFLRLYRLDVLPPGLHYDEAFNATMAQRVQTGVERPIFFTEDLTEEPMAIYITSVSFALFGASPWSLRLVSALAGILTVAALYVLAREMFQSKWIAALASFVLAILYWHINFSRLGMEPIFTPLMMTLSFAFLWRAFSPSPVRLGLANGGGKGWGFLILSGIFLGATMYTYKAALFVPVLAVIFFGIETILDRKWLVPFVTVTLVAIFIFAPLGLYFAAHPSEFLERPSSVTASSTTTTVVDSTLRVAGMFFIRGDENPRSNLPDRPVLDPFLAIGYIAGLVACVVRIRQRESRFMLLWLVVMILPSIFTDYAPHFGRSIGVTPVVVLIVAYGFSIALQKASSFNFRYLLPTAYCLLFTGLAFSTLSTFTDYFNTWSSRTGLFDSFDVGIMNIANKLSARPSTESLFVSPIDQHYYSLQFGLNGRTARSFDANQVLVLPAPNSPATYGIVTRQDSRTVNRLAKIFPNGRTLETIYDWTSQPYAVIYHTEGVSQLSPQKNVGARLGDAVELIGYDVSRDGKTVLLTVYWRVLAEMKDDYTVFVHLLGAMNPGTQSPVWAQDDARPGHGSFPTTRWRADEIVIDEYRLTVPENAPRGNYQIEIGMYVLESGARLRVVNAQGVEMENDRVLLEQLPIP